ALRAGALAALLAGSIAGALAESGSSFLSPQLDGDPKNARFQKAPTAKGARAEISSISTFQPASGAGTTGFNSSGKRKAKAKRKGQSRVGQSRRQRRRKTAGANPGAPPAVAIARLALRIARLQSLRADEARDAAAGERRRAQGRVALFRRARSVAGRAASAP